MNAPSPEELPTLPQLLRATVVALGVAAVVAVTTVLPAEYAIDPTGAGSWLGLTAMGELKQHVEPVDAPRVYMHRDDTITFTLAPDESTEVKAVMRAGDTLKFAWHTDGPAVFYDFHGEPDGAAPDVFTSHDKSSLPRASGTFEAPFDGVHGWYWKNRTPKSVTLTLEAEGVHAGIARLH